MSDQFAQKKGPKGRQNSWMIASLVLSVALSGCNWRRATVEPVIEFTRVPPASEGGPDKLDRIEGRVVGSHPGQRIVLFAKAGAVWYVQPLGTRPFTSIESDSSWKSATHLGNEYGALLVGPSYQPPMTVKELPQRGGEISAVASVSVGEPLSTATHTLIFSGYDWIVRHITSDLAGGISYFDPRNASIDSKGFLHLRVTRTSDRWLCSEVTLNRSLGYGTYIFFVKDISNFEPAAALTIRTWDESGPDLQHREMDIEMSQWGDPKNKNAGYVIQPYNFPENKVRFVAPAGPLAHSLHWEAGKASFQTIRDRIKDPRRRLVTSKVFTTGVPSPGDESISISFCDFKFSKVPLRNEAEVVIERFEYFP